MKNIKGLAVSIVLGIVIAAAVIVFLIPPKERSMSEQKCLNNLRQIAEAVKLYAADNEGLCPPGLKALEPKYMQAPFERWGICHTARKEGKPGHYLYWGSGKTLKDIPADRPLVADYPGNHGEGGNVVYPEGKYKWIPKNYEEFIRPYMDKKLE